MKQSKSILPKGVYGGEVSGANPLEWNLRSTICSQLRALGWDCNIDAFGDNSASWIEAYPVPIKNKKEGEKIICYSIQFNYEGSIITDFRVFEQRKYIKLSDAELIRY